MNPQAITPGTPQQQVIERLRTAVNVLVTVSNNPSVDQLAAAIGFTLTLNKLGKHATAVFSGEVPSTLEFLKPEATLEKNTDSLRDFIVSLDKSKADKLRYKVEENVVKIFITPYRTSLSEKDLMFSQGDFNVDAVVALGVSEREQLDQAIVAHGRILHDATVITVSTGKNTSTLGAINWQDNAASSLCEMLVSVGEALQPGLLDNQIATAYLTGIVAQTERFRNDKTTPRIMTMSAQLMVAGANQQLIATELEHAMEVPLMAPAADLPAPILPPVQTADGSLTIEHEEIPAFVPPVEEPVEEPASPQIHIDEHGNMGLAEEKKEESNNDKKVKRHLIEPLPTPVGQQPSSEELFGGGPHPFTANMSADGEDEPSTDPLTSSTDKDTGSILEHSRKDEKDSSLLLPPLGAEDADAPKPAFAMMPQDQIIEPSSAPAMLPPVADDMPPVAATLPPALDDSTLHDLEMTFDSSHIPKDPTSTLNEIEEVLDSPHLAEVAEAEAEPVDTARNAVESAIQATPFDPSRPEPLQALNATNLNLPIGAPPTVPTTSDPVLAGLGLTDSTAPSSVPAPGMPLPQPVGFGPLPSSDPSGQAPPPVPPPLLPIQ